VRFGHRLAGEHSLHCGVQRRQHPDDRRTSGQRPLFHLRVGRMREPSPAGLLHTGQGTPRCQATFVASNRRGWCSASTRAAQGPSDCALYQHLSPRTLIHATGEPARMGGSRTRDRRRATVTGRAVANALVVRTMFDAIRGAISTRSVRCSPLTSHHPGVIPSRRRIRGPDEFLRGLRELVQASAGTLRVELVDTA
jgi:hypothetical protein